VTPQGFENEKDEIWSAGTGDGKDVIAKKNSLGERYKIRGSWKKHE